jgi:hypothetical protein
MASNEDWHTPAGMQERRFFVLSVASTHMQDADYFEAIAEEMKNGGREAFAALPPGPGDHRREAEGPAPGTTDRRAARPAGSLAARRSCGGGRDASIHRDRSGIRTGRTW